MYESMGSLKSGGYHYWMATAWLMWQSGYCLASYPVPVSNPMFFLQAKYDLVTWGGGGGVAKLYTSTAQSGAAPIRF